MHHLAEDYHLFSQLIWLSEFLRSALIQTLVFRSKNLFKVQAEASLWFSRLGWAGKNFKARDRASTAKNTHTDTLIFCYINISTHLWSRLNPIQGHGALWANTATVGYTQNRSPAWCRAKHSLTSTPKDDLKLTSMFLNSVCVDKTHGYMGRTCKLHTQKGLSQDWNQGLLTGSCGCEPLCHYAVAVPH